MQTGESAITERYVLHETGKNAKCTKMYGDRAVGCVSVERSLEW